MNTNLADDLGRVKAAVGNAFIGQPLIIDQLLTALVAALDELAAAALRPGPARRPSEALFTQLLAEDLGLGLRRRQ